MPRKRVNKSIPTGTAGTDDAAHEVGYGRPPVRHRFKPGVSGNPGGKKKGTPNLDTLIARELDEKVEIRENGRLLRLTKREVGVKAMVNKAVQADIRAWPIIFERAELVEIAEEPLAAVDREALRSYLNRTAARNEEGVEGSGEKGK